MGKGIEQPPVPWSRKTPWSGELIRIPRYRQGSSLKLIRALHALHTLRRSAKLHDSANEYKLQSANWYFNQQIPDFLRGVIERAKTQLLTRCSSISNMCRREALEIYGLYSPAYLKIIKYNIHYEYKPYLIMSKMSHIVNSIPVNLLTSLPVSIPCKYK